MWWILTVGGGGAVPVAPVPPLPPSESGGAVRVGVSAACFSHLAPGALRLGAPLLARHLSADLGRPAELQICDTSESLVRVMIQRDLDVVMLPAQMLVECTRAGQPLVGCVMSGSASGPETSWVLLTSGAGRSGLAPGGVGTGRLEGDSTSGAGGFVLPLGGLVLLADGGRARLPSLWLREVGREAAGGSDNPRFREVIEPRPELAVLRVFLGKADGCVVPESEFAAACADNPQIADRLVRVASSPRLPGAVICARGSQSKLFADRLPAALARLAVSPHGQALSTLLRTGEFAPFDPALMPALERLVEGGSGSTGRPARAGQAGAGAERKRPQATAELPLVDGGSRSPARPGGVSKASSSPLPVPSR